MKPVPFGPAPLGNVQACCQSICEERCAHPSRLSSRRLGCLPYTSRVIGKESEHSMWLLNEGLPVLVSAHKVPPAGEIDVAAHRVRETQQRFLDECSSPDDIPIDQDPLETRYQTLRGAAPATPTPNMTAPPSFERCASLQLGIVRRTQTLCWGYY